MNDAQKLPRIAYAWRSEFGMRFLTIFFLFALAAPVAGAPRRPPRSANTGANEQAPQQKQADRHFKSGVTLFGEQKFSEALAEFERAYEIAPNPIVLYNMASCHRELSRYAEAVRLYNRFLAETEGRDGTAARLTAAKAELDDILSRIARVRVSVAAGARLSVDGMVLGTVPGIEMPLILAPGEHKIAAQLDGKRDAEKTLRLASGDNLTVELLLVDLPDAASKPPRRDAAVQSVERTRVLAEKRLRIHAGFGTNLQQLSDSGVPNLGLGVAVGSRLEAGIDVMLVAYAVMPNVRLRVAGERASLHVIGAVPVAFTDGTMSKTFVGGAGGLGVRLRATNSISLHLDVLASYAGATHGTTFPSMIGGDVWF